MSSGKVLNPGADCDRQAGRQVMNEDVNEMNSCKLPV